MSPTGGGFASTLILATIVASMGAGAYALDATATLESAVDDAIDNALRDLSVDWVDVYDAHGQSEDSAIHEVDLLVRFSGPLDELHVDELHARQQDATLQVTLDSMIQDEDGSLEDGLLTQGDLARVNVPLEEPLPAKSTTTITLHHGQARPITVELSSPTNLGDGPTRLTHQAYW